MTRSFVGIFSVLLGIVFLMGGAQSVKAQESASEEFTLEEITVTAQKREENQQKVPIAMEVISAEDIQMTGKNDLTEILAGVTSVVLNRQADGLRISLRGMSDDTTAYHGQAGSTPTVAINVDGVYSNRKDTGSGLFDLERVEVLYGPQSTLYASNSPGGIVNVVTATPKLDIYSVSGTLEYGNYNAIHTEGSFNAPIGDKMALRASFSTQTRDGYMSNGGDSEDSKSARLRALFQPGDNLSFLITGELTKSISQPFTSTDAFVDQDDVDDPWYTDRDLAQPSDRTSKKVYGSMDLDVGIGTISFVPSYSTNGGYEEIYSEMMGTMKQDRDSEEKGVELRIASSSDSFFKWLIGMNYYDSSDIMDQKTYSDGEATGESKYGLMEEKSKAVFGNITYPVTDRFRATAGLRQSWDDIHVLRDETTMMMAELETSVTDYDHSYSDPDFKLGVEYDLGENTMIYADWSTSYRAQGLAGAGSAGPGSSLTTPPPEELKAYTVGAKNRFMENKLQVNASAYYYDYKNYSVAEQVMAFSGDPANPLSTYITPDPNSSTWGNGNMIGVDIQTTAIITSKDTLDLSVSYLKSEWTDLVFDYYYDYYVTEAIPRDAPAQVVEILPLDDRSYNGKPMTHSPDWTIGANYKHIFILPNGGSLETQINATYKSDYRLTWKDEDYPSNYQEAYHMIDLTANYIHSDGKWTLSAYVRNLENYAVKMGYAPMPMDETRVGSPRTYGAVLSVRY